MQKTDVNSSQSIALDSKKLAEASTRDSSSMKAIAVLTMVFLPSTAVAVSIEGILALKIVADQDRQYSAWDPSGQMSLAPFSRCPRTFGSTGPSLCR